MRARKTLIGVVLLCLTASSLVGASGRGSRDKALHDLYFCEALYYARQGHFFAALERIQGRVPEGIRDDVEFLRANVYLGLGRNDDAVKVLKRLQGAASLKGFAAYNLGIALLDAGHEQEAFEQLDRAGQGSGGGEPVLAIRDKSNLVLGRLLVDSGRSDAAKRFFDRVRLDGPFSNAALLASGWAAASANDYASALDSFGAELKKVDASIASIRDGKFLKALAREEIKQNPDWVIQLRSLPESPETYYLTELAASNDFQTAVQNYLDLEDLRRKLASWDVDFDSFDDMIGLRRSYYEPLLPGVDHDFRDADSRMRLRIEQHKLLEQRLRGLLVAPRPDFLATADEWLVSEELSSLDRAFGGAEGQQADALRERIRRLQGVISFQLRTQYDDRLAKFNRHLAELSAAIDVLNADYESFVRARQAAVHSYEG